MTGKRLYELVPYDCLNGRCLMIHEKISDRKLGPLSFNHKRVGEAIVNELNDLSEKLYNEEMRTIPILLDARISDEDFEKLEKLIKKHYER